MKKIIAIDFDETLYVDGHYGDIGKPNWKIINKCKKLQSDGYILILWTCRANSDLMEAIDWCKDVGLTFDYVNENPKDKIEAFDNDSRKIGASYYLDDRNISFADFLKL